MKTQRKIEHYGLKSHEARFGTEEQCRDYIYHKKWPDGAPICTKCGNQFMNYYISSRQIWKCSSCKQQFSLLHDTIFEGTKLPLTIWFKAIYLYLTKKRGLSSYQLAEWLETEQRTAWYLMHRLRIVINQENDIILSGMVESDETHIGPNIAQNTRLQRAKKRHEEKQNMLYGKSEHVKRVERGHPAKVGRKKGSTKEILEQKRIEKLLKGERTPYQQDIMILGMMERKGRLILKKLGRSKQCVTNENIHPHLQKHITKNSVLITDQWGGYQTIGKEYKSHLFVNHKETFVKNRAYTNNVEGVWNHFKRVILGTYFHMSFHHFDNYLDEFTFRWNRRNENGAVKFEDFMKSFEGRRLKYQDLISKNVEPLKTAA